MPDGYVGLPCLKYLTDVADALSHATPVHDQNPFANLSNQAVPPPALQARDNKISPYAPDTAKNGYYETGIGTSNNIVVEQSEYEYILAQIDNIDDTIGQELYNIAVEIEALCESEYVMPKTVPRCLFIANALKNSLGNFSNLTYDCLKRMRDFVSGIIDVG